MFFHFFLVHLIIKLAYGIAPNEIQLSNVDLNDLDNDKSFEEYKKIIIIYGKHSDFPNIN